MNCKTFAVALIAAAAVPAAAANLVVNGGFETGDFSGWTEQGHEGAYTRVEASSHADSGSYDALLGSVHGLHEISQQIATTPGHDYSVSFALTSSGSAPFINTFRARLGGVTLLSLIDAPQFAYARQGFTFSATGAPSTLEFVSQNVTGFWMLDTISVEDIGVTPGVPEPATWALLLAGFGMTGAAVRRRRPTVVAA